jgi:YD repeat-containing protein
LTAAHHPDGSITNYGSHGDGYVTEQPAGVGRDTLRETTYTRDAAGNVTDEIRTGIGPYRETERVTFAYDAANRLVSESYDGVKKTYTYDKAGNITGDGANAYTYDKQNRLMEVTGVDAATCEYDDSGNLIRKADQDGVTQYAYNARNKLELGERDDGQRSEYSYNALDVRVGNVQTRENKNAGYANAALDNGSEHARDYQPALSDGMATWQRVWEMEVGTDQVKTDSDSGIANGENLAPHPRHYETPLRGLHRWGFEMRPRAET